MVKVGIILDHVVDEAINNYVGINYSINPGAFSVQDGKNAATELIADIIDGESDALSRDSKIVELQNIILLKNALDPYIRNVVHVGKTKLPVYSIFKKILNVKRYIKYFFEGCALLKATS